MEEIIAQWDSVEALFADLASSDNSEEAERSKTRLWWIQNTESSSDLPRQSHRIKFDLIDGAGRKILLPLRLTADITFDIPNEPN